MPDAEADGGRLMREQRQGPKSRAQRKQTHRPCFGWCNCKSECKRSCKVLFLGMGVKKAGARVVAKGPLREDGGFVP